MGLSVSLSNALTGMNTTQSSLEVLSRNVANAGTPGYHKQSVAIVEGIGSNSSYVRFAGVERAFNDSLQSAYNRGTADLGYTSLRADYMQRIEMMLGKPSDPNSLNTVYQTFENSLTALSTSPDDFAARAEVVSAAQTLAGTFNRLSGDVQSMRQEAESDISSNVASLNRDLASLNTVNSRLTDAGVDPNSRLALLDERDRLVASISELVDTRIDYAANGTVNLMTRGGLSLVDSSGATRFEFQSAGRLNASALFNYDDALNGVGTLTAITQAGLAIDVVEQDVLKSGRIAALIDMRDNTLVELQAQLDELASGLALSMSTIETQGTAVAGPPDGFSLDLTNVQPGNSFTVNYNVSGTEQTVRVVRVDDTNNLPMDFIDPNGERVIGLDFSGGIGAVATALDTALGPAINVSNPAGNTLQIVDDGAGNTSDVNAMVAETTVTATQGAGLGLSLFVDLNNSSYTGSLDGNTQQLGFSGRMSLNTDVLNNNKLLVQYQAGASLGDTARADYLIERLEQMSFTASSASSVETGGMRLSGNVRDMINQTLDFQGGQINTAAGAKQTEELTLEAVTQRMESEYGVNIDEEMARLMELQNAYAASARIVSVVQELLDNLIRI